MAFTEQYPDDFAEMQTWGVARDSHGNLLGAYDTRVFKPYGVGAGGGVGGNKIAKFDPTGRILWTVGQHAPGSKAAPARR